MLKQLVTEKYTGGPHGIREHILRMSNMAAKLKPMDADLELKPALLVHLVMASLLQQFENFIINYNMSPEKWDIEKTIGMCSQEEERLKSIHSGSLNYVREGQQEEELHQHQPWWLPFQVTWQGPPTAPASVSAVSPWGQTSATIAKRLATTKRIAQYG
uniref:Uncharacterized protein n=1 Tax=Avena sativa TaxID=4498 RepID=A0ACD5X377_AVESA